MSCLSCMIVLYVVFVMTCCLFIVPLLSNVPCLYGSKPSVTQPVAKRAYQSGATDLHSLILNIGHDRVSINLNELSSSIMNLLYWIDIVTKFNGSSRKLQRSFNTVLTQ